MNVLHYLPGWSLRFIRRRHCCRQCQLRQRLAELQRQTIAPVTPEHWLIVFFEQELYQQCQSLKHINRELARRAA